MKPLRWPLIMISILAGLIGFPLAVGGAAILIGQFALRDADGYYASTDYALSSAGSAVVLDDLHLDLDQAGAAETSRYLSVRVRVRAADGGPVFVGLARQSDLDEFLAGVAHDRVTDIRRQSIDLQTIPGRVPADRPAEHTFWIASSSGTGEHELMVPVQPGRWAVVAMNPDGSAGLSVQTAAGLHVELLTTAAALLLILGSLALLGAVVAARGVRRGLPPIPVNRAAAEQPSPLSLTARPDTPPGRWLWMVKWILALPHFLIVAGLWCAFIVVTLVAGVTILVRGRYPRRLFDFNVGVLRWTWRVGHYSYLSLGTDRYPPFTLASTDFPADIEVAYPTSLARRLVLIKWLLAIPHLLIVAMIIGSTTIFGLAGDWSVGCRSGPACSAS